jgi:hypothetical protein
MKSELRQALDQAGGYDDLRAALGRSAARSGKESGQIALLTGPKRPWWARIRPVVHWFASVVVVGLIIAVVGGLIVFAITRP